MRTITKNVDNQLIDSTSSSVLYLEDVMKLVKEGEVVVVVEETTGLDVTNKILLQCILESNAAIQLFPTDLLHRLIRLSREELQKTVTKQIEHGLALFNSQLAKLERGNWNTIFNWGPFSTADEENSSPISPGTASGATAEGKSVVEQQLENIRSHLAARFKSPE